MCFPRCFIDHIPYDFRDTYLYIYILDIYKYIPHDFRAHGSLFLLLLLSFLKKLFVIAIVFKISSHTHHVA